MSSRRPYKWFTKSRGKNSAWQIPPVEEPSPVEETPPVEETRSVEGTRPLEGAPPVGGNPPAEETRPVAQSKIEYLQECQINWQLVDFVFRESVTKENLGNRWVVMGPFDLAMVKRLDEWNQLDPVAMQVFELLRELVGILIEARQNRWDRNGEYLGRYVRFLIVGGSVIQKSFSPRRLSTDHPPSKSQSLVTDRLLTTHRYPH